MVPQPGASPGQQGEEEVLLKQSVDSEAGLSAEAAAQLREAHEAQRLFGLPVSVVAGACYCGASMSMVLLNKLALSSFSFQSATALLFFQCALVVALVQGCAAAGLVQVEPLRLAIIKVWLPVNLLFVAMIATSFWALQSLNIAMITVLKNLTNLFTLGGDYALNGRTYKANVWGCVGLMLLSAVCGGATDLTFSARGYAWQVVNCLLTASYMLAMRGAMDRVASHTSDGQKLGEFSMVYYNSALSLPCIGALLVVTGEGRSAWAEPALHNPSFLAVAGLSGLIGFAISFTSLWFLSTTTPSIFSLVGSLNKVPLALIGLFMFSVPWTLPNLLSVLVGTAAGVVFVLAKNKSV